MFFSPLLHLPPPAIFPEHLLPVNARCKNSMNSMIRYEKRIRPKANALFVSEHFTQYASVDPFPFLFLEVRIEVNHSRNGREKEDYNRKRGGHFIVHIS